MKMVRGARNFLCAPSKFVFGGWSCSLASKNFVDRVFSFEKKANVLRTRRLHSDTTDVRSPLKWCRIFQCLAERICCKATSAPGHSGNKNN